MMALVLERALSGYAVAAFPMAKNTGLAHTFATAADRTTVRRVLMVLEQCFDDVSVEDAEKAGYANTEG